MNGGSEPNQTAAAASADRDGWEAIGPARPLRAQTLVDLAEGEVRRGGRVVWSGLSLTVKGGELVAVLGPNGAGKSTLLHVLLGLIPLSSGRLTIFGQPLDGLTGGGLRAIRRRIGYLPQRRAFDPQLRIRARDLVALGLEGGRFGLPLPAVPGVRFGPFGRAHSRRRRVERLLEEVEAIGLADRAVGELSGGEQQRVLIAQALAQDPELLLLDEPLNGLDLPSQTAVSELVGRLCRERGIAALLVTHDINPLHAVVDRVLYIAGGKGAIGTVEEVVRSDLLSSLYGFPIEVIRTPAGRLVVLGGPEAPAHHPEHL